AEAEPFEVTAHRVEMHVGEGVAKVRHVVGRDATDVDPDLAVNKGPELTQLVTEGGVEPKRQEEAPKGLPVSLPDRNVYVRWAAGGRRCGEVLHTCYIGASP